MSANTKSLLRPLVLKRSYATYKAFRHQGPYPPSKSEVEGRGVADEPSAIEELKMRSSSFKTAQLLATRLYESFIGKYIILPILALLALALIWSYVYAKYADFVTSHSIIDDYQWIETSDVEGAVEHWLLWRLPLVVAPSSFIQQRVGGPMEADAGQSTILCDVDKTGLIKSVKVSVIMHGPRGTATGILKFVAHLVPNYEPRKRGDYGILESRPRYDLLLMPTSVRLNSTFGLWQPANPNDLFGKKGAIYITQQLAARDEIRNMGELERVTKMNELREEQIKLMTAK